MNTKAVTNPLISVIVPVYNTAKYLDKCITSIVNQTYTNLEIILVDDGSTDDSPGMCDAWAEKDTRIKVIHTTNKGQAATKNKGLDIMTGELVGFIDSDDYVALDMYEVLYKIMNDNDADLCICDLVSADEEGNIFSNSNLLLPGTFSRREILSALSDGMRGLPRLVSPANKLYRAKIFDTIRFPIVRVHEDNIVIHRIFGKCSKIAVTNKVAYFYVQHVRAVSVMSKVKNAIFHTEHFICYSYALCDFYDYLIEIGLPELTDNVSFQLYVLMIENLRKVNYLQFRQEINIYIWETFRKLLHSKTLKNKLRAGKLVLVMLRSLFRPYVKQ